MDEQEKQPRILVVDDDPIVRKLLENALAPLGYEVLGAADAPTGLEKAMKELPDLIVLDVMMPIINGFNICRLLKSEEGCKRVPIILLTSRSSDEDRKIGLDVGADAYFTKPLNTQEFLAAVQRLLS